MPSVASLLPQAHTALQRCYSTVPKACGSGRALPPLRLAFVITHRCNLKCAWCMVTHEGNRRTWNATEELSPAGIERVVRQSVPWCMVTITGGEPFVRHDIMDILDRVARLRPTHLVTNGTVAHAEQIDWLAAHAARAVIGRGLVTVGVSLEGPADLHDDVVQVPGSHAKTLAFVERLLEARRATDRYLPLIDMKVVLSKDNWASLPTFRADMARLGVDMMTVQIQNNQASAYGIRSDDMTAHLRAPAPVDEIPAGPLLEMLRELSSEGRSAPGRVRFTPPIPVEHIAAHYRGELRPSMLDCHATWTTAHVGPYGDLFPCFSYPMGSVRHASLAAIWNGPSYRAFRTALKAAGAFPGCIGCCMASAR